MEQLYLPGEIVKKSNAIARAKWNPISIWEPRIVALVASKVKSTDEDFHTYSIPVAELTGFTDENLRGNQYQDIAKSIRNLIKATIEIQGINPRNFMMYTVFAKCGYENGNLIAQFHPDLKPHFLNLKEQFTAYNLFEYLKLPSSYSQQIFELLKSWSNCPDFTISLQELHELLNTPDSFKVDFAQFRRRVLDKAYKDIHNNKPTSLKFGWETVKKGRAVVAIKFIFSNKNCLELQQKKEIEDRQKKSAKNNKLFVQASLCAQSTNPCVPKKNDVCAVCRRFEMRK